MIIFWKVKYIQFLFHMQALHLEKGNRVKISKLSKHLFIMLYMIYFINPLLVMYNQRGVTLVNIHFYDILLFLEFIASRTLQKCVIDYFYNYYYN